MLNLTTFLICEPLVKEEEALKIRLVSTLVFDCFYKHFTSLFDISFMMKYFRLTTDTTV